MWKIVDWLKFINPHIHKPAAITYIHTVYMHTCIKYMHTISPKNIINEIKTTCQWFIHNSYAKYIHKEPANMGVAYNIF